MTKITDVKGPTVGLDGPVGTVSFTTSSGLTGSFNMATETWTFGEQDSMQNQYGQVISDRLQ